MVIQLPLRTTHRQLYRAESLYFPFIIAILGRKGFILKV